MTNKPLVYPWKKVVYSALKPGTKTQYFILLECGHVFQHGCIYKVPKKKSCCYCAWGSKTIDLIYWEHDAIRWAYIKLRDVMEKFNVVSKFAGDKENV